MFPILHLKILQSSLESQCNITFEFLPFFYVCLYLNVWYVIFLLERLSISFCKSMVIYLDSSSTNLILVHVLQALQFHQFFITFQLSLNVFKKSFLLIKSLLLTAVTMRRSKTKRELPDMIVIPVVLQIITHYSSYWHKLDTLMEYQDSWIIPS